MTEGEVELVSIGASVASGCRHCLQVHVREARKWDVPTAEMRAAMEQALRVRESSQAMMARLGFRLLRLKAFAREDGGSASVDGPAESSPTRLGELVSIAASHAVNCTVSLEEHLKTARAIGVPEGEIEKALDIARFVKGKADSLCCKWL